MFKFKSERVDHCFGETSVNPFRQCWSMEGRGASGIRIFLLLFYIFISESGCSFIVSQQMICLVGEELQSFFLHVYVLPRKKKTRDKFSGLA